MPSTLGAVLPFVVNQLIAQKVLNNSGTWTSNLQNDFNALQSDIVRLGPNSSTTIADLSRTTSDFGFAQQTFDVTGNIVELLRGGLAFGIANGFFDQSDVVPILFTVRETNTLVATTNSQQNTVNAIAHTPFANGVTLGGQTTIAALSRGIIS